MATYTVEYNGKVFDIEGPDGATEAQLLAAAQQHKEPVTTSYGPDDPGLVTKVASGFKHAWDKAALGLADLTGADTSELKTLVESGKTYSKKTGLPGTVGDITGQVVLSSPLSKALTAARMAAPVAEIMGNALYGLGTTEGDLTERAKGALESGVGAAVGGEVGRRVAGGVPWIKQQARDWMESTGVQPTVGMVSKPLQTLEQFMTRVPIIGELAQGARNRAAGEFSRDVLERTTGQGMPRSAEHSANLDAANEVVSNMYNDVVPYLRPDMSHLEAMNQAYQTALRRPYMTQGERDTLTRGVENLTQPARDFATQSANPMLTAQQRLNLPQQLMQGNYGGYTGQDIKQLDSELGHQVRRFARSPLTEDLSDAYSNVQTALRDALELTLPPDRQGIMRGANRAYRDMIAVNTAAGKSPEELITPRALVQAIAKRDRVQPSEIRGDLADFARESQRILPAGQSRANISGPGLSAMLLGVGGGAITGHLPAVIAASGALGLGSTRTAQALLTGNTAFQRALRRALRRPELTDLPATTTAAAVNQE